MGAAPMFKLSSADGSMPPHSPHRYSAGEGFAQRTDQTAWCKVSEDMDALIRSGADLAHEVARRPNSFPRRPVCAGPAKHTRSTRRGAKHAQPRDCLRLIKLITACLLFSTETLPTGCAVTTGCGT